MKSRFKKKKLFVVIFVIVLLIVLNLFQKDVRNFFYFLSQPLQEFLWQRGRQVSGYFEWILESRNLLKELEDAKTENKKLTAELEKLKAREKENQLLREALGVLPESSFELILASVTAKDSFSDSILINAGAQEGVLRDSPVITQQKVLVGKVSEVYQGFSLVLLSSNREMSFSAKIQEISNIGESEGEDLGETEIKEIKGVIKGMGNGELSFNLALREAEIKKGDVVVTDVLGGVFPEALLVGKVESAEQLDAESFQKAKVSPFFDLKEIDNVFVIKKW